MFARIQTNRNGLRDLELEHMLGVVCRTLGIAMAPAWKDLVNIRELPVHDAAIVRRVDAGFLFQFPRRGLDQRLAVLLAAGDRLPEARKIRPLQQQHAQIKRVHQHQRRHWNLAVQGRLA